MWIKYKNERGIDTLLNTDLCSSIHVRPFIDVSQNQYWNIVAMRNDGTLTSIIASFTDKKNAELVLECILQSIAHSERIYRLSKEFGNLLYK